ncbi:MAG: heme biosynthesis HemY N-terminal domain-containing protein [Pseudomonadota bacterium]
MWNMVIRFIIIALLAVGAVWLAERPGTLTFDWLGYTVEISIMAALILLAIALFVIILAWALIRRVFNIPGALSGFFSKRKRESVHEALTKGIIAVGAGDSAEATKYARKASSLAGDDPLAQLLKAQAAQLRGDQSTVTHVFEAMAQAKDTEALGLRGLFTQARQDGDMEKARAMAATALERNSGLVWASKAMLAFQSASGEWAAVGTTLDNQRIAGILNKDEESRLQAVVQTARAIELEESQPDEALSLAERALRSAPDLVPAAVVAGRILSSRKSIRKASRLLEKTWKLVPHPDVAEVYAFLRSGDSPQDRQKRIKTLTNKHGGGIEGAIALAVACIDAQDWKDARTALAPHSEDRPPVRVCELMAEIEQGEFGDKGRAREWLSRAVRAPRDPAWVADGHISKIWLPVSPVTGELDAFEWQVPMETLTHAEPEPPVAEPDLIEEPETPEDVPAAEANEVEDPTAEEAEQTEPEPEPEAEAEPEPVNEKVVESESVTEEKTEASANGADDAPNDRAPEAVEASNDPVDMHRPDDPGPPTPDEAQAEASKPWYQGMFSR